MKIIMILLVMAILVFVFSFTRLDEIEKHDEAVSQRWAKPRESEPPEWADSEKWWESEGRK